MRSSGRVLRCFYSLRWLCLRGCLAYAADRPTAQEILRDWYYLMNELVRHYDLLAAGRQSSLRLSRRHRIRGGGRWLGQAGIAGWPVAWA